MQLYDCPNCGALEPGVHRDTCSLAGEPVWPGYSPPDWSKADQLLADNYDKWQKQWPGWIVLIDAATLQCRVAADDKQAFPTDPKFHLFGPTPPTGRPILVQYLMTDQELEDARARTETLTDSPA